MISNVERVIKKSLEDAKIEGMEQGIVKGMEKGIEKGIEKGMEKGMVKGMEKVAKQMLSDGEEITKIMRYTGLSKENIERLK